MWTAQTGSQADQAGSNTDQAGVCSASEGVWPVYNWSR